MTSYLWSSTQTCEMSCKVSRLLQKIYLQVCTKRYLTLWALFQSRKDNLFTGAFLALFRFSSVSQEGTVKMCLWIAFECGCVLQNTPRSVASRPEICAVNKTKQTNKQLMRIFKCLRLCTSEVQFISHLTHLQLCIFLKSRIIFHLKKTENTCGNRVKSRQFKQFIYFTNWVLGRSVHFQLLHI